MDLGMVVDSFGLCAAFFALVASVALGVELGVRPIGDKAKNDPRKMQGTQTDGLKPVLRGNGKEADADNGKLFEATLNTRQFGPGHQSAQQQFDRIPERPLDLVQSEASRGFEQQIGQMTSEHTISDLQRRYVDGFLGSRKKYDVAIALLNQYQGAGLTADSDEALTMATEAYLSATRAGPGEITRMDAPKVPSQKKKTSESSKPGAKKKTKTDTKKPGAKKTVETAFDKEKRKTAEIKTPTTELDTQFKPTQEMNIPTQGLGIPTKEFGKPTTEMKPPGFGTTPPGFGAAPTGFGATPPGVGNAPAGFGAPPTHQPPGFGQQPPNPKREDEDSPPVNGSPRGSS